MTEVTGERFIPEAMGGELIEAEHQARYRLAAQQVVGKSVLDAGCGVGWGTELLLDSGAESATGVDIAHDAVAEAARRVPGGSFLRCDLQDLPFCDSSFDVVTCFEAIEHVADASDALDELARVVAPGGLVMVSSPNPRVYPPGNPFHVRELNPEELFEALSTRFSSAVLLRQYDLAASCLVDGHPVSSFEPMQTIARSVIDLPGDHDLYSVVIATSGAMPSFDEIVMLSPQTALKHMTAVSEDLRRRNDALLDELDATRRSVSEQDDRIRDAEHTVAGLRREFDDIRQSTSWRSTAFLRRISGALRKNG